jgi:type IV secretory pathway VirB10-like protein
MYEDQNNPSPSQNNFLDELKSQLKNKKMWLIAAVALIILATIMVFAYFVMKKTRKTPDAATTTAPVTAREENSYKPLTPEEIQAALNKKTDTAGNAAGGGVAPKPLTPSEIQNALNKKSTTESSGAKPLTPEEIQAALNKKSN